MGGAELYRIPFVVGVTGHRDPLPSQVLPIRAALVTLLQRLKETQPGVRIQVLCSMADGADLLIAEVALELDLDVLALLTFPEDVCRSDLLSEAARTSFDRVMTRAQRLELPMPPGLTREKLLASTSGPERDRQYHRAGLLLARFCSLLIAIWDGKPTAHVAGSARVVEFRRHGSREQGTTDVLLESADNDLLFEIHCARASDPAAVAAQPAISIPGFSGEEVDETDRDTFALPAVLQRLLSRTGEFNRDSIEARAGIAAHAWPLLPPEKAASRAAVAQLNQLFVQADYLGSYFRQRFLRGIRRRYLMWASMATLLIAMGAGYAEGIPGLLVIIAVLSVFVISRVHAGKALRHSWHRKGLDYRALAEALRVDYFWEITGVRGRYAGEFAHESFLQKQDTDLGWIRAAMRAISLRLAMHPIAPSDEGMAEAMKEWIGDQSQGGSSGQISYYNARSRQLRERVRRDEWLDQVPVWVGTVLSVIFLIDILASLAGYQVLPQSLRVVLLWAMALSTAYGSIYEVYVTARGDRPLIRQYRHMHGLFGRAASLLRTARTDDEKLEVLRSLGHACLAEHAQWTLAQRDKGIEGLKW
jgi:hypothetical protein